jgi:hypothetical protein
VTCSIRQPGASEPFVLDAVTPAQFPVWFHVYCTKKYPTKPETFSQGWGDTRFAPISTGTGSPVHTYYLASTPECAYMESVLHEIRCAACGRRGSKNSQISAPIPPPIPELPSNCGVPSSPVETSFINRPPERAPPTLLCP